MYFQTDWLETVLTTLHLDHIHIEWGKYKSLNLIQTLQTDQGYTLDQARILVRSDYMFQSYLHLDCFIYS